MDRSLCSIIESSCSDLIDITEIETATLSQMKILNENLDKEVDRDLVTAFNDISENEDKSVDGSESEDEDQNDENLHTDSSCASGEDVSLTFSADHQNNIEFENGQTKENSCDGTEESSKNKVSFSLQDSQNLISDYELEKNKLLEEVKTLKLQLSSEKEIKNEMQSKLVDSELTIKFLEKQLSELNTADHLSRDHLDRIVEKIKFGYESDIAIYKENIDELQSKLNSKVKEAEEIALENSELQRIYEQLQIEVNEISEEFLAQKKCQQFLESGAIEEINRLKLQVQHLEEEKAHIERENVLLKESFFQRWARSLLLWQLHCLRRVSNIIGLPFF